MNRFGNIERHLMQMNIKLKSLLIDSGLIIVIDALESSFKQKSIQRVLCNIESLDVGISLIETYFNQCYCVKYDVHTREDIVKNYGPKEQRVLERILQYPFWLMDPIFSKESLHFKNVFFVDISIDDLENFKGIQNNIELVHTAITKTVVEEIIEMFKEKKEMNILSYVDELGSHIFLNKIQEINDFKVQANHIIKECMRKIIKERDRA
ncbi:hypothetical protein [Bacillus toyonensis]|uniref:hypothetical protein n=1 Tax=Bacillus toyonensis TaxID=155322 RepID=UPI002E1D410D|nr:hypothetical protein [Bacillus toyonensis]